MSSAAEARVREVVAAGRRVADPRDPLGREARARLVGSSGLSAAGVELALREHLEREITAGGMEELLSFARGAGGDGAGAPRCHVVLSANVCTAALRAIAVAAAAAPALLVKPSRRDPVVAELCARALAGSEAFAAAGGSIAIAGSIAASPGDEVHAYGRDETIEAIRAGLPGGVALRAHGAGFGVAIAEEEAEVAGVVASVVEAVVPFDQRGCLSPRVLLVEGGAERAIAIAESLARGLASAGERVPRGAIDEGTRAEVARYVATASALGAAFEGPGFAVGCDVEPRALALPPAARVVHVAPVDAASVDRLVGPWREKVTAAGSIGGRFKGGASASLRRSLPAGVRLGRLADMQRPPLDGPVDRRWRSEGAERG